MIVHDRCVSGRRDPSRVALAPLSILVACNWLRNASLRFRTSVSGKLLKESDVVLNLLSPSFIEEVLSVVFFRNRE